MEIQIVRLEHKPWGVDGHLYINRKRVCDTVEHPTRHLPSGEYVVEPAVKAGIVESKSESEQAEWRIPYPFRHGDGALGSKHSEIIVGKQLMPGVVTQSQQTYDRLYERLKKAFQRGNTVRLKVVG